MSQNVIFGPEQMLPARRVRMCVACHPGIGEPRPAAAVPPRPRHHSPRPTFPTQECGSAPTREPSTLESPRLSRLLSEHRRASYQEPALSNMTGNMWSKELGCWRVSRTRRPMVVEDCLEARRCPGHQRWPTSHFKPPTTRQPDVRWLSFEENSKEMD